MLNPIEVFGMQPALAASTGEARDAASRVFSDIRMVEVGGQELRVGIRRGNAGSPPLIIFNGIGANLELLEPFVRQSAPLLRSRLSQADCPTALRRVTAPEAGFDRPSCAAHPRPGGTWVPLSAARNMGVD